MSFGDRHKKALGSDTTQNRFLGTPTRFFDDFWSERGHDQVKSCAPRARSLRKIRYFVDFGSKSVPECDTCPNQFLSVPTSFFHCFSGRKGGTTKLKHAPRGLETFAKYDILWISVPKQFSTTTPAQFDFCAPLRGFSTISEPRRYSRPGPNQIKPAPRGPGTLVKYDISCILAQARS